ncbi:MAG: hypothetical protein WAT61_04820 [Flavobacteriales bacterium]|jgi:hypothetical protein
MRYLAALLVVAVFSSCVVRVHERRPRPRHRRIIVVGSVPVLQAVPAANADFRAMKGRTQCAV